MPFVFPVVGSFAVIASALTAVLRYVKGSALYAVGGSLIEAFDALEGVEFTANTLIHGGLIGKIVKITDEEVKTINEAFNLD